MSAKCALERGKIFRKLVARRCRSLTSSRWRGESCISWGCFLDEWVDAQGSVSPRLGVIELEPCYAICQLWCAEQSIPLARRY